MQRHENRNDSSAYRSEFFGICCESGKRYSQVVSKKFHISMAALDPSDSSTLVSLLMECDGCQYLLCSLKPDTILQVALNLYFDKGEDITFFLRGQGAVHLSGYYICDEGDAGLTKNSIKGQNNALAKAGGKKPQTTFTVSADIESSDEEEEDSSDVVDEVELPKGKVVSPVKKLFTPNATPVSPNKRAAVLKMQPYSKHINNLPDDSNDSDYIPDETEDATSLTTYATKRVHSSLSSEEEEEESSDDDDDDDDDDSDSEDLKAGIANIKKQLQNSKKFKAEPSTPTQNNKAEKKTPLKTPAVKALVENANSGKPDLNSSIGRTPMPKKPLPKKSINSSVVVNEEDSSGSDEEMETSVSKTPEKPTNQLDTSAQNQSAKKKKKKKKNKGAATSETQDATNKSPFKAQFSTKLPTGVEYEDLRVGNGLPAKKGRLVHVYYTGKLEDNKVFDSCQQGSKPFSFKLAGGDVIKGWDLGIEGMKVGGKRKLKIPPKMGYGNSRMGVIPPNSTLYFTVELKAVS